MRSATEPSTSRWTFFTAPHAASDDHPDLQREIARCAAPFCVWLVEALPRLVPGVTDVRLDLTRQVARAGGTTAKSA